MKPDLPCCAKWADGDCIALSAICGRSAPWSQACVPPSQPLAFLCSVPESCDVRVLKTMSTSAAPGHHSISFGQKGAFFDGCGPYLIPKKEQCKEHASGQEDKRHGGLTYLFFLKTTTHIMHAIQTFIDVDGDRLTHTFEICCAVLQD